MKLFIATIAAVSAQSDSYQPTFAPFNVGSCFTCVADSWEKCERTGRVVQCSDNQQVCDVRVEKKKNMKTQITTGCKEYKACRNNQDQNFVAFDYNGKPLTKNDQACRSHLPMGGSRGSVCNQCCNTNENCVKDFLAQNEDNEGPREREAWMPSEDGTFVKMMMWKETTGQVPNPTGVPKEE